MKTITYKLTFIDNVLATTPGNQEIYADYIASKATAEDNIKSHVKDMTDDTAVAEVKAEMKEKKAEEIEAHAECFDTETELEKGTTFFFKDEDGEPYIWSYWISGFFKSACSGLKKIKGTKSEKIKAYKKEIDLLIKPFPDANDKSSRKIKLHDYGELTMVERPLRAQTMQGERVALARSESAQPGTWIQFDVVILKDDLEDAVTEWMDYGVFNGLGQWRNSGKGAFEYEVVAIDGKPVKS